MIDFDCEHEQGVNMNIFFQKEILSYYFQSNILKEF